MNAHVRNPGAISVGQLSDQPVFEACMIIYMRHWSDGEAGQSRVRHMLIALCGPARGAHLFGLWAECFGLIAQFQRRALMRHAVQSPCICADEACFAAFIKTAANGDREDALMRATNLVRVDVAPVLTDLATQVGLQFNREMLRQETDGWRHAPDRTATLH